MSHSRCRASTNAAIGPLPTPSICRSSPLMTTVAAMRRRSGGARLGKNAVIGQLDPVALQIGLLEQRPDPGARHLLSGSVGHFLHPLAELDLQTARQIEPVIGLQHIGDAALAGLAVDPDHRLVGAAQILRIDRQIRHFPQRVIALGERLEAFFDRVLMRARESGVDELAGIGMPWMHRKLIAVLDGADDLVDVGDHQPGIDPLAEQIERQGDDIDIAGALAIAEERAFHPLRARPLPRARWPPPRCRGRCADAR